MRRNALRKWLASLVALALLLSACATQPQREAARQRRIRIGFSLDTLQEERWQRDRDLFVAHARSLGADVLIQAAASDDDLQLAQAENMLRRGIDVLVIVPHDSRAMAPVVEMAHTAGVKVIAYDRLILDADLDLYISFDNEKVGELQAKYLLERVPRGNYVYVGGAETDHNALMLQAGALKVLQPHIERGEIQLVYNQFTPNWLRDEAKKHMTTALTQTQGKVDAVISGNDATAGSVIEALYGWGLAGQVPVAGQDADLAAVRRIVDGTQSMTVYKPIRLLANQAAEAAVALAMGKPAPVTSTVFNGRREVPAYLITPIPVDRRNLWETVIADGFHSEQDVFGTRETPP